MTFWKEKEINFLVELCHWLFNNSVFQECISVSQHSNGDFYVFFAAKENKKTKKVSIHRFWEVNDFIFEKEFTFEKILQIYNFFLSHFYTLK